VVEGFLPRLRVYALTPRRYTSVRGERGVRPCFAASSEVAGVDKSSGVCVEVDGRQRSFSDFRDAR